LVEESQASLKIKLQRAWTEYMEVPGPPPISFGVLLNDYLAEMISPLASVLEEGKLP